MAMVKCKECEKEISSSASKCPHCGKVISNSRYVIIGVIIAVIIIGAILIGKVVLQKAGEMSDEQLIRDQMNENAHMFANIVNPQFSVDNKTQTCINNLKQIDAAKELWYAANWRTAKLKSSGDSVNIAAMCKYLNGNKMPVCPEGGTYVVDVIGKKPTCSIPTHRLSD